jgi:antitoxin HicB
MNQEHIGSNFDDFLREEQLFDAAEAAAVKRVIAFRVSQEMKRHNLSKREMAARMKTSRAALERVLDPSNTSITLATLGRAAAALGQRLTVDFQSRDTRPAIAARKRSEQPARRSRPATRRAGHPKE